MQSADEEHYLTSEYILKLAPKASELFESFEPVGKRLLLKMTLQNLVLDGKKPNLTGQSPLIKSLYTLLVKQGSQDGTIFGPF